MKCPLAHSSVGVDVGLAVRTGVGYIFQIVDHTRNETAAQVTSEEENKKQKVKVVLKP